MSSTSAQQPPRPFFLFISELGAYVVSPCKSFALVDQGARVAKRHGSVNFMVGTDSSKQGLAPGGHAWSRRSPLRKGCATSVDGNTVTD